MNCSTIELASVWPMSHVSFLLLLCQCMFVGIKPEVVDHYRTAQEIDILYAPCEDTVQGHKMITEDDAFLVNIGRTIGTCVSCGEEA